MTTKLIPNYTQWGKSLIKQSTWSWSPNETVTCWYEAEIPHAPTGGTRNISVMDDGESIEVVFGDMVLHNRSEVQHMIQALSEINAVLKVVADDSDD